MKRDIRRVNFSWCGETPMQTGAAFARRQVLRMISSGVAVFAAWAKAFAVDKLAKSDIDYRDRPKGRERCDNCRVLGSARLLQVGGGNDFSERLVQHLAAGCRSKRDRPRSRRAADEGRRGLSKHAERPPALRQLRSFLAPGRLHVGSGQNQPARLVQYLATSEDGALTLLRGDGADVSASLAAPA